MSSRKDALKMMFRASGAASTKAPTNSPRQYVENAVTSTRATRAGMREGGQCTPNAGPTASRDTRAVAEPLRGHWRLRPNMTQPMSPGAAASRGRVPWPRSQLVETTTVIASMTQAMTALPMTR
ncbi:hypothetical protein [Streptomyces sp. CS62]|uniref:hypothetical protein n=1 Tax=Streptomyces sp. CS62 TaxID=3119268 RepID=UPI002F95C14F